MLLDGRQRQTARVFITKIPSVANARSGRPLAGRDGWAAGRSEWSTMKVHISTDANRRKRVLSNLNQQQRTSTEAAKSLHDLSQP